ncbi:MAG TPA: hypothetical protein VJL80_08630 [Aeromicrobium sp.]|nr:hypothetical protein [Aeromicrobium sp.]HKY58087.1 hypothetical protein [Aeromicrobium sp.]
MKIAVRLAAFAAVLAAYYGIAVLLPAENQSVAGLVAIATVAVGVFLWARRDGRTADLPDGLRDWLVVTAVVSVLWWVTLLIFEGADDVATRLSDQFLSVVLTAAVLFAPAVVGLLLGRDGRGA